MSSSEILKHIVLLFDKVDKIFVIIGSIFILIGADFKFDWKGFVVNFDKRQAFYFRTVGAIFIFLAILPVILGFFFRPVNVKDLVELKDIIDATQESVERGLERPNRPLGDNSFHARKEMTYVNGSNTKAQTKINDMIKLLSPKSD